MKLFTRRVSRTVYQGLTSLELIVVLAIFGILSGITMFNYGSFSAGVNLQNTTQQVALRIQQAQTEAISGRYPHFADSQQSIYPGWKPAFGTYFATAYPTTFAYFFDQNGENAGGFSRDGIMSGDPPLSNDPSSVLAGTETCGTQNKECLDVISIKSGEHIVGICNDDITAQNSCHDNVSISFQRPFPPAKIIVEPHADGTYDSSIQPVERVTILILGKNSQGLRGVVVTRLGQIYTRTLTAQDASTIHLTQTTLGLSGIDFSFFNQQPQGGGCQGIQC